MVLEWMAEKILHRFENEFEKTTMNSFFRGRTNISNILPIRFIAQVVEEGL